MVVRLGWPRSRRAVGRWIARPSSGRRRTVGDHARNHHELLEIHPHRELRRVSARRWSSAYSWWSACSAATLTRAEGWPGDPPRVRFADATWDCPTMTLLFV